MESENEFAGCHPRFGRLLPNGNLLIPLTEWGEKGEMFDSQIEISQQHPQYVVWLRAINEKEDCLTSLKDKQKKQRQTRIRRRRNM